MNYKLTKKVVHPGIILRKNFLDKLDISEYRLAKDIKVPARRINEITHCIRSISADTALRFEKYFGIKASFWLQLQARFDTKQAAKKIKRILTSINKRSQNSN